MKSGGKSLILTAVAIATGALIIAAWSYCPPRQSLAQCRFRRLVAELRGEPPRQGREVRGGGSGMSPGRHDQACRGCPVVT